MRMGVHQNQLAAALQAADRVLLYRPEGIVWDMAAIVDELGDRAVQFASVDDIIDTVVHQAGAGTHVLIMSNGGFDNIHARLLEALHARQPMHV
jgi:UDP-N-acetylmuramate: L-alanyl-gamma-D-glutamyl-meso-diaminopimelate ligase